MSTDGRSAADWVGSFRTSAAAWWLPQLVIVAALLLPSAARGVIWVIALAWMGTACLLNSRRCGRMHCRFTGPYYLAMILPTLLLGAGMIPVGFDGWLVLGGAIIIGGKVVWWATERAWGKYSSSA
jgi:hypothetical protein